MFNFAHVALLEMTVDGVAVGVVHGVEVAFERNLLAVLAAVGPLLIEG